MRVSQTLLVHRGHQKIPPSDVPHSLHEPYECGVCERVIDSYEEDPFYRTLHKPLLYSWGFHKLRDWRDVERPMIPNDRPEPVDINLRCADDEDSSDSDNR